MDEEIKYLTEANKYIEEASAYAKMSHGYYKQFLILVLVMLLRKKLSSMRRR